MKISEKIGRFVQGTAITIALGMLVVGVGAHVDESDNGEHALRSDQRKVDAVMLNNGTEADAHTYYQSTDCSGDHTHERNFSVYPQEYVKNKWYSKRKLTYDSAQSHKIGGEILDYYISEGACENTCQFIIDSYLDCVSFSSGLTTAGITSSILASAGWRLAGVAGLIASFMAWLINTFYCKGMIPDDTFCPTATYLSPSSEDSEN